MLQRIIIPDREPKLKLADELMQEIEALPDLWRVRADLADLTGRVVPSHALSNLMLGLSAPYTSRRGSIRTQTQFPQRKAGKG